MSDKIFKRINSYVKPDEELISKTKEKIMNKNTSNEEKRDFTVVSSGSVPVKNRKAINICKYAGIAAGFVLILGGLIALTANKNNSAPLAPGSSDITSVNSGVTSEASQTEAAFKSVEDLKHQTMIPTVTDTPSDNSTAATWEDSSKIKKAYMYKLNENSEINVDFNMFYLSKVAMIRFFDNYINENKAICDGVTEWLSENDMLFNGYEKNDILSGERADLSISQDENNINVNAVLRYAEPKSPKSSWQYINLDIDYTNLEEGMTQNNTITYSEGSMKWLKEYLNAKGISVDDEGDVAAAYMAVLLNCTEEDTDGLTE